MVSTRAERSVKLVKTIIVVLILAALAVAARQWSQDRRQIRARSYRIGWTILPPLQTRGADGGPTGLAVELIRDAAARQKINLQWVFMDEDPEDALLSGRVDLWPILTVTPSRRQRFFITGPLLEMDHCLLVPNASRFRTLADLKAARIGTANLKLDAPVLRGLFPESRLTAYGSVRALMIEVCSGASDAAYMNEYSALAVLTDSWVCGNGFHWISVSKDRSRLAIASVPAAEPIATILHDEIVSAALERRLPPSVAEWGYLFSNIESMTRTLVERRRIIRLTAAAATFAFLLIAAIALALRIRSEKNRTLQAQQALRRAAHRTRLVTDQLHEGIATFDMKRRLRYVNRAFEACSASAHLLEQVTEGRFPSIYPDHQQRAQEHWEAAFRGLSANDEELRVVSEGGEDGWLRTHWGPILDEDGTQVGVVLTTRNITASKRAEESLNRTSLRLSTLLSNAPLAVIEWTADHRIASWLGGAEQMFGWTREEVTGKSILDFRFVHEEDLPQVHEAMEAMTKGLPAISRNRNYRKDGAVVHCEWYNSVVPPTSDHELAGFSLVLDITDRHAAELALRASEKEFRDIFEAAPIGIVRSTIDGRFLSANPQLARMFGYASPDELIEQVTGISHQLFANPERRNEILRCVFESTGFVAHEVEYRHRRGGTFIANLHMRLERDERGEPLFLEGFVEDITERKRAEENLRRAHDDLERRVEERTLELSAANERLRELDRLKSQFLASMSHELRTPLNSIIGFTSILHQGLSGPINAEQNKQLGIVQSSARHLLSLINDLLDVSRIEAGRADLERQPFDFVGVLHEVVQILAPLADRKALKMIADNGAPHIPMEGDRKRALQVLLNLANNAVKFTPKGSVTIRARSRGEVLEVNVADTGIGIKPEQIGMLFEAFRQVDGSAKRMYEGTGLGLYLCRKLLEMMGGTIQVESVFGEGSCFTYSMPLRLPDEAAHLEEGHRGFQSAVDRG